MARLRTGAPLMPQRSVKATVLLLGLLLAQRGLPHRRPRLDLQ